MKKFLVVYPNWNYFKSKLSTNLFNDKFTFKSDVFCYTLIFVSNIDENKNLLQFLNETAVLKSHYKFI